MVRLAGRNLNPNKVVYIALTAVYGVGILKSKKILQDLQIPLQIRTHQLSTTQIASLQKYFEGPHVKIEGELKRSIIGHIKRLIDIHSYRGQRHLLRLPVRGQRSRSNSRTVRRLRSLIDIN
jgi:small subunit ribosomal protein S13